VTNNEFHSTFIDKYDIVKHEDICFYMCMHCYGFTGVSCLGDITIKGHHASTIVLDCYHV